MTENKVLVDHLLKTDLTALAEAMEGTVAQSIVDPENPKTALSVRAMLTANLGALEFLPDTGKPFSIRDWISNEDADGFLFLTSRGDQHASLRGLISTWLEIAVNAMLSLAQDDGRHIWVILDELPTLHQVPSLQPGLAESRQFSGCFVLGVQVASALRDLYGRNGAETISGLCGTRVVLAAPDRDTAQWSADSLGRSGKVPAGTRRRSPLHRKPGSVAWAAMRRGAAAKPCWMVARTWRRPAAIGARTVSRKRPRAVDWAVAHLSEREAVFSLNRLLAAALAWNPGEVTVGEAEAAAARTLSSEAGIGTETLQCFLARYGGVAAGRMTAKGEKEMRGAFAKTVLVVDEGSLASTVQARDLLRIADALCIPRVVLVGDEKQLDAVDAGKPFALLQAAGMKTALMDQIMRQRDPTLKEAVEASLAGDIAHAFEKLGENAAEVNPDNLAGAAAASGSRRWRRSGTRGRRDVGWDWRKAGVRIETAVDPRHRSGNAQRVRKRNRRTRRRVSIATWECSIVRPSWAGRTRRLGCVRGNPEPNCLVVLVVLLNGASNGARLRSDTRRQRAVGSRAAPRSGPCFFWGRK